MMRGQVLRLVGRETQTTPAFSATTHVALAFGPAWEKYLGGAFCLSCQNARIEPKENASSEYYCSHCT